MNESGTNGVAPGMRLARRMIPMRDGVRLAVNLFMPQDADPSERFPPILEYLPYRKDDGTLLRDVDLYAYVVPHGYVGARVDIRGTGASEGALPDREYSEQEQRDAEDVIAWLADQPWSNGNVGMWGISWGGFNSIQMAMRATRPDALKAIIAVDATDDLFQDDVHYIDGLLHIDEYVVMIDLLNAMTPAPEFPLDEETLAARFDAEPWLLRWLKEQRDGEFWRRGSLAPGYERLGIPAFLIGGYLDGYRDSVPRMLERCTGAPVKALVGPWNHAWPHDATPGPEIEWRHEALRWWDRWLKGTDNGIELEPKLTVYIREWYPPGTDVERIPGRWRHEAAWPVERTEHRTMYPGPDGSLRVARPEATTAHFLQGPASTGTAVGQWWGELVPDQRPADAFALVYQTDPLPEDLEILGMPVARLVTSAGVPLAHWFVRLSDVAPDGRVTLVTGAGRSGAHRESAFDPSPLEPGREYDLDVELHFTSWVFPRGHRIRMAVSNALWPMIWPAPDPTVTTLRLGGERVSSLSLPVVPPDPPTGPPDLAFPPATPFVESPGLGVAGYILPLVWTVSRDEGTQTSEFEWSGTSTSSFPWGRQEFLERLRFRVSDADPARASAWGEAVTDVFLKGRHLRWRGLLEISSDRERFNYRYTRELFRDGTPIRTRTWDEAIARDFQ